MRTLNLYQLWEICNLFSNKEQELSEQNIYVHLLGNGSNYSEISFERFLEHYSFKIEDDVIIVFNDDGVPYENFTANDFSYIPAVLVSFSDEKLENWIKAEIDLQLKRQEREKEQQKESIKAKIERLKIQLNNL